MEKKTSKNDSNGSSSLKIIVNNKTTKDKQQMKIDPTSETFLASLIHPMPVEEFLKFRKENKAFASLNHSPSRLSILLKDYLCEGDLKTLLEETPSEEISLWIKNMHKDDNNVTSIKSGNLQNVYDLYHNVGVSFISTFPKINNAKTNEGFSLLSRTPRNK